MEPGKIITFYSYKGGTGRTMALSNIACLLAERRDCKRGILMIDWDLEAPGLHKFFFPNKNRKSVINLEKFDRLPGLIDLWCQINKTLDNLKINSLRNGEELSQSVLKKINIQKYIQPIDLRNLGSNIGLGKLFIMKAGYFDEEYPSRVSKFDWENLHKRSPWIFKSFADELANEFDFVLIDSRTGITDTSGICTMIMPEKLVVVFTPNSQSLTGVPNLIKRAIDYRQSSDDLRPLVVFPLPSRIENTEPTQKEAWRNGDQKAAIEGYQPQFEVLFKDIYGLDNVNLNLYFDNVQLQHVPTYSYGEKISVLKENRNDRQSLANSFDIFTNWLIDVDSPWNISAVSENFQTTVLGDGAIAQGGEAKAIGGDAIVISGNHSVVNIISPDSEKARGRYLERLRKYCLSLPLIQIENRNLLEQEIPLDNIYIDLDSTTHIDGSDKSVISVYEAAVATRYMVLLGDPGSGKSTFVRYFISRQATAQLNGTHQLEDTGTDLLPILITLRDVVTEVAQLGLEKFSPDKQREVFLGLLRTYAIDQLAYYGATEFKGFFIEALESGNVLLVFDGLDEIPQQYKSQVKQAIQALIRQYEIKRIIITCRTNSYVDNLVFPEFESFTISPFNDQQITKFVHTWYDAQEQLSGPSSENGKNKAEDLICALKSSNLMTLAGNPLTLSCIAIIHQKEARLPTENVKIYNLIVDLFLRHWQNSKSGVEPFLPILRDEIDLRLFVERIAYVALQKNEQESGNIDISLSELINLLEQSEYPGIITNAFEFINYLEHRAGLISRVGDGSDSGRLIFYRFSNRIIQEYLAGCYLVRRRDIARAFYELAEKGKIWDQIALLGFQELFYNRRETSILLDLTYQLLANDLSGKKYERASLWAGQIIDLIGMDAVKQDTHPAGGKAFLDKLTSRLVELLTGSLLPLERTEAGRILAKVGDPRPGVGIIQGLPNVSWVKIPSAVYSIGSLESPRHKVTNSVIDEAPPFKIHIKQFSISQYLVTNAQFMAFELGGDYSEEIYWSSEGWKWIRKHHISRIYDNASLPVVNVSWYEAMAFCAWLSKKSSMKVILPSEVEWEVSARGTDSRIYPWGNEFNPDYANLADSGIQTTSTVGCFSNGKSPFGVEDLVGNVWEWTRSIYKNYPYDPNDGREKLINSGDRVIRGGSFRSSCQEVRCSARLKMSLGYRADDLGFRLIICDDKTPKKKPNRKPNNILHSIKE
jgi:formylglycine-generating enzyme required for sulfatase activity/cellulose biosynthesis protein BcsQ